MHHKLIYQALAVASVNALVPRDSSCCFHLTAYGGPGGVVGQLGDGQNRIGDSSLPEGEYCISGSDITDGQGRGCILTPPTTQWQCDTGAKGTQGFSIWSNGSIAYNSDDTFYACPTGDHGGWNIYSQTLAGQNKCVPIWLEADDCVPPPPPPPPTSTHPPPPPPSTSTAPPPPPPSPTSTRPTSTPPTSTGCPRDLPSGFQFPHLIIPIDSSNPNEAYGTSYDGSAGGSMSTIFNFDIPESTAGQQCQISFLFPQQSQLTTSSYTFSGSGGYSFSLLSSPATSETTYANAPSVSQDFGTYDLSPGNAYTVGQIPCPAGKAIGVKWSSLGGGSFKYFQDYNQCPIGLYLTTS